MICSTLKEAGFADGSFDVVTLFHVIEHVASPSLLVRQVCRVVKPGGHVVIETPTIDSLWYRLLGSRWRQFIPDHYWFFSAPTLHDLLERNGIQVSSVARVGKSVTLRLLCNRLERLFGRRLPGLHAVLRAVVTDRPHRVAARCGGFVAPLSGPTV